MSYTIADILLQSQVSTVDNASSVCNCAHNTLWFYKHQLHEKTNMFRGGTTLIANGISIVTTTWNERENVGKLINRTRSVLGSAAHEIIVVDDDSPDGTSKIAQKLADKTVKKSREGQSKGLLCGMKLARYDVIITIDADLENDPKHIPELAQRICEFDILVASRTRLPRISEKLASGIMGRTIGVKDIFSNFRAYKKETVSSFALRGGETFGAEFLVIGKKKGFRIGEIHYKPSERRPDSRIGGRIKANLRIAWALFKALAIYLI
jgi:dolichol-phosphate mannosyltransferase